MWITLQFIRISVVRAGAYYVASHIIPDHDIDKYRRRVNQIIKNQTGRDIDMLGFMDESQMEILEFIDYSLSVFIRCV
jgi:hypothetical protein